VNKAKNTIEIKVLKKKLTKIEKNTYIFIRID